MTFDLEERDLSWNSSLAETLPGRILLVGLAYFRADSNVPFEQEQLFGRVISADEKAGIVLSLQGSRDGESFTLPPDTRSFQKASAGEYRLRSTGEVIVDPDFTVTFSIYQNSKADGHGVS